MAENNDTAGARSRQRGSGGGAAGGTSIPSTDWIKRADSLTPTDLALIAANIGTGLDHPDKLARRALELWQACAEAIDEWPAVRLARICASLPQPTFPVTLPQFLELMLPGHKPAERIRLLRRFIADHYQTEKPDRVDALYRGWDNPISENGYYHYMKRAFLFREWLRAYEAERASIAQRLEPVSAAERVQVQAYLESQAAVTCREACDAASLVWGGFADEIWPGDLHAPPAAPAVEANGKKKR